MSKLQSSDLLFNEIANSGDLEKVKSTLEKHHKQISSTTILYHYNFSLLLRDQAQASILIDYLPIAYMNQALVDAASTNCFDIAIELILIKHVAPTKEEMVKLLKLSTSENPPERIETLVAYAALSHNLEANGIPAKNRKKYFESKTCLTAVSNMPGIQRKTLDKLVAATAKKKKRSRSIKI